MTHLEVSIDTHLFLALWLSVSLHSNNYHHCQKELYLIKANRALICGHKHVEGNLASTSYLFNKTAITSPIRTNDPSSHEIFTCLGVPNVNSFLWVRPEKSDPKVVGYAHNNHATVVPTGTSYLAY